VPGYFEIELHKGESVIFSAGLKEANPIHLKSRFTKDAKKRKSLNTMEDCLTHAGQQFIVKQGINTEVIAGYPWFGRWGRDTFIALPGLTLSKGNAKTCKAVIDTMVKDLNGPLFPNLGSGDDAAMNSVDAPLWFFWTLNEYAAHTSTLSSIWKQYGDKMKGILEGYCAGTQFNIKMQPNGLIYAGVERKALTWMDAMYEGEAFTPRIGLPVEINALWYHAVCFSVSAADVGRDGSFVAAWKPWIKKIKAAFIQTFWNEGKGYLADCVRGDDLDWSIRPNQIFATSLQYSPLNGRQCKSVLEVVKNELLTSRGLRTLSPRTKSI